MKSFPISSVSSHKSKKKRQLVSTASHVSKHLFTCRHSAFSDYDTGETVCKKCHQVLDHIYVYENKEKVKNNDILIWNRDYDKQRWIIDTLEYINGEHNDCFNDLCWMELLEEIPNPCTWTQVYQVFHYYRLTDYWTCFPSYVGLKVMISRKVLHMVLQYSHLGYTKYRISFMYLFYKFTQMEDQQHETDYASCIPLKGTKAWIKKTDEWWQTICQQKEWEYIPSKMCKMSWEKTHIVDSLKSIMESLS